MFRFSWGNIQIIIDNVPIYTITTPKRLGAEGRIPVYYLQQMYDWPFECEPKDGTEKSDQRSSIACRHRFCIYKRSLITRKYFLLVAKDDLQLPQYYNAWFLEAWITKEA